MVGGVMGEGRSWRFEGEYGGGREEEGGGQSENIFAPKIKAKNRRNGAQAFHSTAL